MKFEKQHKDGELAYQRFKRIAESQGWAVKRASDDQDINEHIDAFLKKDGRVVSVDVKDMKKLDRSDLEVQDKYAFVEYMNVKGKPGWLFGKADIIAFATKTGFCVVGREALIEYCNSVVDRKATATKASDALHKVYRREGRRDSMTLIELANLPKEIYRIWSENDG